MLNLRVLGTLSLVVGIGCLGIDLVQADELTYGNLSESMIAQSSNSIAGRWSSTSMNQSGGIYTIHDFNNNGTITIYTAILESNGSFLGGQEPSYVGSGNYKINGSNIIIFSRIDGQEFKENCTLNNSQMVCRSESGSQTIWEKM